MCAARRTTSTRLTRLAAKASPYHSAVTLYEAASQDKVDSEAQAQAQAGSSTLRRSSRVKHEPTDPETSGSVLDEPDNGTTQARTVAAKTKGAPLQKKVKTEIPDSDAADHGASRGKSAKKPTSKPKAIPQALDVPHPAPDKWADAYAAIKEMRSRIVAPVDTMGCDQAQLREREPKVGGIGFLVVTCTLCRILLVPCPLVLGLRLSRSS